MQEATEEYLKCLHDPVRFVKQWCQIFDAIKGHWIPFVLWPQQEDVLRSMHKDDEVIALKARQLGLTWLALAYSNWTRVFRRGSVVMLFSKREDEASDLMTRMQGMYKKLPKCFHRQDAFDSRGRLQGNSSEWPMSDGGRAMCFPTTAGDSYSASLVIVDEADLIPNLDSLMSAVKPTRDAGGKLFLISRSDKSRPQSPFKRLYRGASNRAGENSYIAHFLPWNVRPERTKEWYEKQKRESLSRTGSLDHVHEQYPATDAEALAPRSLDKRIPAEWLNACYQSGTPMDPVLSVVSAKVPGGRIYKLPEGDKLYSVGADPAEGNVTSDDSALIVTERQTGEEVFMFRGKTEPDRLTDYAASVARFYNGAGVLYERNNHGHACISRHKDKHTDVPLLSGGDGKFGWLSNTPGKVAVYDAAAEKFREGHVLIRSFEAFCQLASIESNTLRAPEGEMDDLAMAYVLSLKASDLNSTEWQAFVV